MDKDFIKYGLPLFCKAVLVVLIGTFIGYYFPDLTPKSLVVSVSGYLAIKYLSSFHWFGAFVTLIFSAGHVFRADEGGTEGDVLVFMVGRSILTFIVFWFMAYVRAKLPQDPSQ